MNEDHNAHVIEWLWLEFWREFKENNPVDYYFPFIGKTEGVVDFECMV